ncbi:prenyltransferase [Aspergillus terreus]|uniref:Prenyltransferase n=1 Tax=Aspergillus terreus TaxID=33178 RepID=A0A5M3Z412_ASPTE|nr:hypothetical protein ATETN484_0009002200 [Aspergillus terreus]GFF17473.1 prenyltransferase [Aspergillus terreus]
MTKNAVNKDSSPSPVWAITSRWLDVTPQSQHWWILVGSQLAKLAQEAGYSVEEQFEMLLFLRRLLPRVGSFYSRRSANWTSRYASMLTNDGSPFEYSWKWNTDASCSSPEIRYCIEPIGPHTATPNDPFNYLETEKLLVDDLAPRMPQVDLTWFYHFADALGVRARKPAALNPDAPPSSMFVAFEHVANEIVVKAYFIPPCDCESGGAPSFATFANAARGILMNTNALDSVLAYVKLDPVGSTLTPDMLAIDCIDTTKSRLKLYANTHLTSFASVVSVMTMGGRIPNVSQGIKELEVLFRLVLGLETGFSWEEDLNVQDAFDTGLAHPFDLYARMTYYFDIAPNSTLPDVKLYIPVLRYAKSDKAVASGLGEYLRLAHRGRYHQGFVHALDEIRRRHPEGSGHRLQTFIAVAFQRDGSLAITSYINPGAYHPDFKAGPNI